MNDKIKVVLKEIISDIVSVDVFFPADLLMEKIDEKLGDDISLEYTGLLEIIDEMVQSNDIEKRNCVRLLD